jgi:hypothetical protein
MPPYKTLALSLALLAPILHSSAQTPPSDLRYHDRGDRWEGLTGLKKSGSDLELLSAVIAYQEPLQAIPDRITLSFYLPSGSNVFVTVRGVVTAQDYWLDKISPPSPWIRESWNSFTWGTTEVIKKLPQITSIYDFGVVANIGSEPVVADALELDVAPAIVYSSKAPRNLSTYLFVFKPITYASLDCRISKEGPTAGTTTLVSSSTYPSVEPGIPFTVTWDGSSFPKGWYRLEVSGLKRFSNDPLDKTIRFYNAGSPMR